MIERMRNGSIRLDGQRIDMYQLGDWLQRVYEVQTGRRIRFREVDEALLKQAVNDVPGVLRRMQ